MSVLAGDEVKPKMAGEFMMSSVQDCDGACLPPVVRGVEVRGECFSSDSVRNHKVHTGFTSQTANLK